MQPIAKTIHAARQQSGFTQQEVADRYGCKKPTISMYETGKRSPSVEVLEKLAAAMNCELVITFNPKSK